ncbi:hypothetical protein Dimus_003925 [Dionaea muscipula]
MSVIHLKKKDVVKSKVRGVDMEFDHEKLATILGVPGTNGICEYIKDVWEESKYTKPLEITRRFANDENLMAARRLRGNLDKERNSMMLRIRNKTLQQRMKRFQTVSPRSSTRQKEQDASGVDPSSPTGRIPKAVMTKLQAEFERKRANRFLADLEKAKAENAKLLALLHQAQSKSNP